MLVMLVRQGPVDIAAMGRSVDTAILGPTPSIGHLSWSLTLSVVSF